MAQAIVKTQITLIKALEGVKTTYPAVWEMLSQGLREMLEPEARFVVRAPSRLKVFQGRAQIADDILGLLHNCSDLAERIRQQSPAPDPTKPAPKFE